MPIRLFEQLEAKIENLLDTVELTQLEVQELESKNKVLEQENRALQNRQIEWEKGLQALLGKLENKDQHALLER